METRPQTPGPVLRRGILLGLAAAIMASVIGWGIVFTVEFLIEWSTGPIEVLNAYGVIILFALATIVFSLLPGTIGGTANAYLLFRLLSRSKLTLTTGVVSGLVLGFLLGFVLVPSISLISDGKVHLEDVQTSLMVAAIGAFVGAWHGWTMSKWLRDIYPQPPHSGSGGPKSK